MRTKKRRIRNAAPSRGSTWSGNMCRPERFTKGQRLRRRPRAGSDFALHRTGEPVGRHLQGHQGNGKTGRILLQTDSVLSPNESATLLAETFP
ncbi:hypothetical protein EVAR_77678_1 [Eumeta japonica]|uniref:Uncharacterized protein n=1 Tax=Eumeta variegata TaxID=151549 RepID=A0A4C2ABH5_EUMVA|nr:hypothetical protein EVAR_77678_1 [Eumeta japonica]